MILNPTVIKKNITSGGGYKRQILSTTIGTDGAVVFGDFYNDLDLSDYFSGAIAKVGGVDSGGNETATAYMVSLNVKGISGVTAIWDGTYINSTGVIQTSHDSTSVAALSGGTIHWYLNPDASLVGRNVVVVWYEHV